MEAFKWQSSSTFCLVTPAVANSSFYCSCIGKCSLEAVVILLLWHLGYCLTKEYKWQRSGHNTSIIIPILPVIHSCLLNMSHFVSVMNDLCIPDCVVLISEKRAPKKQRLIRGLPFMPQPKNWKTFRIDLHQLIQWRLNLCPIEINRIFAIILIGEGSTLQG